MSALDPQIEARANDLSQVQPEWGLANCAAFIAAPRRRTAGLVCLKGMAATGAIIADSERVRNRLEDQWLHLAAIAEHGTLHQWQAQNVWRA